MLNHIPVLKNEVITALNPKNNGLYVDCTFGAGGHSRAILDAAPDCFLYAIDRDPTALEIWQNSFNQYANKTRFIHDTFANALSDDITVPVDGILMDLGMSSMQLDNAQRGFSFARDGKLCMRMSNEGISAYDIVNYEPEDEIAHILYYYANETKSRRIAGAIAKYRQRKPIETTLELAEIVRSVLGRKKKSKTDPATKTFMAIRMRVNDELTELARALNHGLKLLRPGGRIVIISFNSSEDRIIKTFMNEVRDPFRDDGLLTSEITGKFKMFGRKIKPAPGEIAANPRSRSAGLRIIEKVE